MRKLGSAYQSIKLLVGLIAYYISGKRNEYGYQAMITLFTRTGGKSSNLIHRFISFFNKPYDLQFPIQGNIGSFSKDEVIKIAKEIEEKGFYVFPNRLSDEVCNKLLNFAIETKALVRPIESDDNSLVGWGTHSKMKIDRENPISIRYDFETSELIKLKEVQNLLADLSLVAIAQEYLKSKVKSDVMGMWWHTAFSKEENPDAATMHHFDMDRIKWLKFFFYLTDTTVENGAHQFIEGSHNGNIPDKFMKLGYARLNTQEVEEHYGKSKVITYEAPRGTVIAEDTSGLHRGYPVQQGDRLLFQIQYSDSLFGAESKNTQINQNEVIPELQNAMNKYPEMYDFYRKNLN